MKKLFCYKLLIIVLVAVPLALSLDACKKDKDGSPDMEAGNPVAESLTPSTAAGGTVLTLKGSGLGDIRKIIFDKDSVPASFYTTLNTESSIVFRVPDTISGGAQNIIFTNSDGKTVSVPFKGLAYPKVIEASDYNFVAGTTITLTGVNMEEVSKVVIDGTTSAATIVSKAKKKLVITMPGTTLDQVKLAITNPYGTTVTTQEFIYKPNHFIVFDDDWGTAAAYGGNVQSWSFDCNAYKSTAIASKAGAAVLQADYTKGGGGMSAFLGCNWSTTNNLTFSQFYKTAYISFWAYAEGGDINITIVPDNPWSGANMWGAATASGSKTVTVAKGKWTYFKIPADFIKGDYSRLDFNIEGKGDLKKTVYYDDIIMVK
jgi:hypothetical protein